MDDSEKLCRYCGRKGTIPYYYMGLKPKVKNWFKTENFIKSVLDHWHDKNSWLHTDPPIYMKEIWHGKRWQDLKWFSDPNSWFYYHLLVLIVKL